MKIAENIQKLICLAKEHPELIGGETNERRRNLEQM